MDHHSSFAATTVGIESAEAEVTVLDSARKAWLGVYTVTVHGKRRNSSSRSEGRNDSVKSPTRVGRRLELKARKLEVI